MIKTHMIHFDFMSSLCTHTHTLLYVELVQVLCVCNQG